MTETFQTVLQDFVGDDYPKTISIGLQGFGGFIGADGGITNKIILMNLSSITVHQINGVVSRDLVYKNDVSCQWSLGLLRNLKISVYLDD